MNQCVHHNLIKMNKLFAIAIISTFFLSAKAQTPAATPPAPTTEAFGVVSKEDLALAACDFEKDANAMVLFNKADLYYDDSFMLNGEYHKRIKIFNDKAKDAANIHLEFYNGSSSESIFGIQAQTINLVDGKVEITKLDKKTLFLQHIDKNRSEWVFTMPNVKAGSIIEYKYKWTSPAFWEFPTWYFQEKLPTRYSEMTSRIPEMLYFKKQVRTWTPFSKRKSTTESRSLGGSGEAATYLNEIEVFGISNIPSLPVEPYMPSDADNVQSAVYELTSVRPLGGFVSTYAGTWPKVGGILADDDDFGGQLKRKLNNEETIINKASALKTVDQKIAYVFNAVRNDMKWNGADRWYTNDGTYRAWENKAGNSAEINLILYHLLKKSGVNAYPMVVSTRDHGKVNPYNPALYQFNRAVVYVPVDSTQNYVLDATDKYNVYNETPSELLNSSGFYIDKASDTYDIVYLQKQAPVREVALIQAEIKPDGKITGVSQLNSFSYNKIADVKKYKTDGEKKYIDYLREDDNNLKISSIKFENMEVDSLPLVQNINFDLALSSADDNYIYFNPNLFTSLHVNPFLSPDRTTNIDFGYRRDYLISGMYKEPAGYKVDVLPKSVSMTMPDKSIAFKRIVAEQDGEIIVRYTIEFKKRLYFKEDYPEFFDFFKKMTEMMNEQVVFKKS